jgi:hypothetical protein
MTSVVQKMESKSTLSVLDAMHFLAASWDLISAAISNCFRKAGFSEAVNERDEIDNQMEGTDKGAWEMLQQDLNFTCSFNDFVEIDDYVLPCGLISIDKLCDESSEAKDTNETSEESMPVPMYYEAVRAVETLQQFLQSVSDVPQSVMKSV